MSVCELAGFYTGRKSSGYGMVFVQIEVYKSFKIDIKIKKIDVTSMFVPRRFTWKTSNIKAQY